MSSISMSNDENLIYVLLTWVFLNVNFRHFGGLKMRFLIIRERVLLSHWIWIYLFWDLKYLQRPPLSHVNSDCQSSNTRIPHLTTCISMSNDVSLIYVLVSWVFHNVHFRHFSDMKRPFLLILQRVFLNQLFWIYLCWDYT